MRTLMPEQMSSWLGNAMLYSGWRTDCSQLAESFKGKHRLRLSDNTLFYRILYAYIINECQSVVTVPSLMTQLESCALLSAVVPLHQSDSTAY
uniref:DUF1016 family protein n=1 Tax=Heterorhabditis bacteriophora TaxID=37862 RepID=A0A1I7X4P7_HETBA